MTCVETLFNPDLNSCKKTIKGHLEKVELRGNIRENCYLWVFLHLSFYFEIIFKMHAVIRKTRKIPATLCPALSMVTFCKTVVQYHSGKITKYSHEGTVYLMPGSSRASLTVKLRRVQSWAGGAGPASQGQEDGRAPPSRTSGTTPPAGRSQAAGRATARQLGTLRGPQGSEPSLNKAGLFGAFSHFLSCPTWTQQ